MCSKCCDTINFNSCQSADNIANTVIADVVKFDDTLEVMYASIGLLCEKKKTITLCYHNKIELVDVCNCKLRHVWINKTNQYIYMMTDEDLYGIRKKPVWDVWKQIYVHIVIRRDMVDTVINHSHSLSHVRACSWYSWFLFNTFAVFNLRVGDESFIHLRQPHHVLPINMFLSAYLSVQWHNQPMLRNHLNRQETCNKITIYDSGLVSDV